MTTATHALPRGLAPAASQVALGAAIAATAGLLTWFLTTRASLFGLAVVAVVFGAAWFATTRRTLLALGLLMIYLGALDGPIKLATGHAPLSVLRDVLIVAVAVGVLARAHAREERMSAPPLTGWVAAFVVLVFVALFNPQAGSLTHSLAGLRQHLEFVPLFFLTFAFVRTVRSLRMFVVLLVILAAVGGVVSWVQFNLTPEQFASWGPGYAERVLGGGGFEESARNFYTDQGTKLTRPFGLGSDAGSGGLLAAFAVAGVLALASLFRRARYLVLAAVLAIGVVTAIVTSQGRGAVVASVVVALAYGALSATSRGRLTALLGVLVAGVVAFAVTQAIVGSAGTTSFRYEGLDGGASLLRTTNEARGKSLLAIPANIERYPLGAGLATGGPASSASGGSELAGVVDVESEFSFLTLEVGVIGALVMTGFVLTLLALGLRRCREEPDPEARVLLAAVVAPLAGMLALFFPSVMTASTPGAPYLWASAGIVAYWLVARPAQRRAAERTAPA